MRIGKSSSEGIDEQTRRVEITFDAFRFCKSDVSNYFFEIKNTFTNVLFTLLRHDWKFFWMCCTIVIWSLRKENATGLNHTLKIIKPLRLMIMFCGENASVEKHQYNDEPVECLRFDSLPASPSHSSYQPVKSFVLKLHLGRR